MMTETSITWEKVLLPITGTFQEKWFWSFKTLNSTFLPKHLYIFVMKNGSVVKRSIKPFWNKQNELNKIVIERWNFSAKNHLRIFYCIFFCLLKSEVFRCGQTYIENVKIHNLKSLNFLHTVVLDIEKA